MLKPGDPCPCCGQPIKTNDPAILSFLTYVQRSGANQIAYHNYVGTKSDAVHAGPVIMEDEECTPT